MINFVNLGGLYKNVISEFINPILPYLNNYEISLKCKDNVINVIFFVEEDTCEKLGVIGDNCVKNAVNVFMSHGIADKLWRNYPRVEKFDYICVSGDLWKQKMLLQGCPKEKILLNGYTKIENTYNKQNTYKKKYNNGKKTILFAPTHRIGDITTNDKLNDIISILEKDFNIIYSVHPADKKDHAITGEEFLEADVVVADFGSTVYESWIMNKPVVFADWVTGKSQRFNGISIFDIATRLFKNSYEGHIYREGIGYHAKTVDEFIKKIKQASENGITKKEIDFIDQIFNKELRGVSGKITAELLIELEKKHGLN